jgi:6-phosphofructokinase 1
MNQPIPTEIPRLGEARIANPIPHANFVDESVRVPLDPMVVASADGVRPRTPDVHFELAGPRERIYFDPAKARAWIVTAGGLCPGINAVIRSLVMTLHYHYGVRRIDGVRYGLQGFVARYGHDLVPLTPDAVKDIHQFGGTILGSSRGSQPIDQIVDGLEQHDVQMLFLIGGNGTMRAAEAIHDEIARRGLKKAIVGLPKTIDNDIHLITRTFGFETAAGVATQAVNATHVEAEGAYHGIGLIKVMGRNAGFVAAHAALASKQVNFLLVPEQDFDLDGEAGLLTHLTHRVLTRGHALVLVSEGAGQRFFNTDRGTDASGNARFGDIGQFLKERIAEHFATLGVAINLKYIDPSYIIRSVPASADDNVYCGFLGQHAVHAAMSGRTGLVLGRRHGAFLHLPLGAVNSRSQEIDLAGPLWQSVLETTGQPESMKN